MDVNLNTISFLRRDQVYNFTQIDDVYEEIVKRNVVYKSPVSGKKTSNSERVVHDSENLESGSQTGDYNDIKGISEQEDLLSAPSNHSNRDAFNFICSLPYTDGDEFDQNIQKILNMQNDNSKAPCTGLMSKDTSSMNQVSSQGIQGNCERQSPDEIQSKSMLKEVSNNNATFRQESEVVELCHSTNTNNPTTTEDLECDSFSVDSDQVHRVRKKDIPASVRSTLAFGIEQQRAGSESLESEQQRRLNEFTLWRRELMRSRVPPTPSP
mmetsp:Transcript_10837/g.20045  ORF Transcript_10837/g.20045 Transcript_10837/m.20045 type:complete len:268 (+) Transcript_10837:107-910(+)